ncbi:MAG: MFS transporter [Clostridia bacterium]|nr:MFS transporter [Clostridia bacterium]
MSVVGNLPPLLFLTFRSMYGISYSLLGLLILISFFTQLIIDLAFSFFSHRFNISKTVKSMPYLTGVGLLIYAVWPVLFPQDVYAGLVIGTIVFSASAGLGEVLLSPVFASIPCKEPDREMSKLHSVYAWGTVGVVIISTLFLLAFGTDNWQFITALFIVIPIFGIVMYNGVEIPDIGTPEKASGVLKLLKNKGLWLCVAAIFLGGAAECTMAQWSSSYLEQAFGIVKVWGDIFGVALFAVMLGLGRTLYSKYGKSIERVLLLCSVGTTLCYLTASIATVPLIGLIACALTGFCTSMLWPGSLVMASDRFPQGGVFIYAMMASGGDLGASVAPQLVGIITDIAIANPYIIELASSFSVAPEELGIKLGMLIGMMFPLISIPLFFRVWRKSS